MTPLTKILITLCWVLLAAHVAMLAWAWPLMPEVLPQHFGISGSPDSWAPKGFVTLGILPLVHGLGLLLFTVIIPHPEWSNLPTDRRFREYGEEAQRRIARVLQGMLASIAGFMSVLMSTLSYSIIQIGLGNASSLPPFFPLITAGMLIIILIGIVGLRRAAKEEPVSSPAGAAAPPLTPSARPSGGNGGAHGGSTGG